MNRATMIAMLLSAGFAVCSCASKTGPVSMPSSTAAASTPEAEAAPKEEEKADLTKERRKRKEDEDSYGSSKIAEGKDKEEDAGTENAGTGEEPDSDEWRDPAAEESPPPDDSDDEEQDNGSADPGEKRQTEKCREEHEHIWTERKETIRHEEEGHYERVQIGEETVVDSEAWEEPVYVYMDVCSVCGYRTTGDDIVSHMFEHTDENGDPVGSYSVKAVQVDTIHHAEATHKEPVFEEKWVVDREAFEEEVTTGYICSICGAEK